MKLRTITELSRQWRASCATIGVVAAALCATNAPAQINWISADVGNPTLKGSVVNNSDGSLSIIGGGDDIWGTTSDFHFYYAWAYGYNWQVTVEVDSFAGPNWWSKLELMALMSDPNAGPQGNDAFIANMWTQSTTPPVGGIAGQNQWGLDQWRTVKGGNADWKQAGTIPATPVPGTPGWMRLTRTNSVFTIWWSADNVTWNDGGDIDTASSILTGQDNGTKFGTPWPELLAVGVGVTAHDDANTSGATAVIRNLTATFPGATAPTAITPLVQVQNATTTAGSEASFSFSTTNNAPVPIVLASYQWYKNGALLPGATGTALTFLAAPSDNQAKVYCKATIPPPMNTSVQSLNSATGVVTVLSTSLVLTNGLKTEFWANQSGGAVTITNIENGDIGPATWISLRPDFDDPGGYGNYYASRVSGFFIPPTSDSYTFFLAADDTSDLFLSTDSSMTNKQLIAQEKAYSGKDSWLTAGSGSASQKRSDQWVDGNGVNVWGAGIPLVAGNRYYIEVVHYQGTGGDNLGVTYQTTAMFNDPSWLALFTNGVPSLMQASNYNIAAMSYPDTTPVWTLQPTNLLTAAGSAATFYATASSGGEFAPAYQWYRGGVPIAGATSTSVYLPNLTSADNAATFFSVAIAHESGLMSTSMVATLTVAAPVFEPGFVKVEWWLSIADRTIVEKGNASAPDHTISSPRFEAASTASSYNNYVNRLSAMFTPTVSGNYVFFVNSDDASDLYVSTDNTPANKVMVAQETGWSGAWQWTAVGGGSSVTQKRSDQFVDPTSGNPPYPNGIPMTAGTPYYIEQDHQDTGGGNNAEATYKQFSDPDPALGEYSGLQGSLVGIYVPRAFNVAFTMEPTNTTVAAGGNATLYAQGSTDSKVAVGDTGDPRPLWSNYMIYQWFKNGNPIAGATTSSYTFGPVTPLDASSQFVCKIRALGYQDSSGALLWSNSVPVSVSVAGASVWEPGFVQYDYWKLNPGRASVESFSAGPPTYAMALPAFEGDLDNFNDNFTDAMLGYFMPPTTGAYVFFLNSDDDGDLWLSTDTSAQGLRLVANETGWASGNLTWGASSGTASQVRSDTFVDPTTKTTPYANGIVLFGGQKYLMWVTHHDGGGGNELAVNAKLLSDPDPASGSESILRGSLVGAYFPACKYVSFTNQPQSQTTAPYTAVTFTASGITDSTTPVSGEHNPLTALNNLLFFQWYKSGVAVPGATTSAYTIGETLPSDNNAQISCQMRALGYANASGQGIWTNSQVATLNVTTNVSQMTYAGSFVNSNYVLFNNPPTNYITLAFSTPMDPALLSQMSTYTLSSGMTLLGVWANSNDYRSVALAYSGAPTTPPGQVTVSAALTGMGGGYPVANTSIAVNNATELTDTDIGPTPGIDPAIPGMMYVTGTNAYTIACEGSDIWANADGFNFAYETKTGDFDVVVRVKHVLHTSNWAKAGLMVRETLDSASRNWNIVNDPLSSDGIAAPDGSGYGASLVECNARNSTNGASGGWDTNRPAPAYPNAWVRLKRVGTVLYGFASKDGVTWTQQGSQDPSTVGDKVALPDKVYVGICCTAHNNDTPGTTPPRYVYTADMDSYGAPPAPPVNTMLTVTRAAGGSITVSWTPVGGRLLASPALGANADWQPTGAANGATLPVTGKAQYYRVVTP